MRIVAVEYKIRRRESGNRPYYSIWAKVDKYHRFLDYISYAIGVMSTYHPEPGIGNVP